MSTGTRDTVAPRALGAPYGTATADAAMFRQWMREMEERFAFLERTMQMQLDEAFFAAARASLDSHRTQVRTGTRDGEWMERRDHA